MSVETDRLNIRLLERRDLEFARIMHNEESVLLKLSDASHVSELRQEEWFAAVSLSKRSCRYTVLEKETGAPVGIFRVDDIDLDNRSVRVGLDIVKDKRGKGYAKETYCYFLSYFFNQRGFHRIYLATLETNEAARRLYTALGFVEEGRGRGAIFRDGGFKDLIRMSILVNEWKTTVLSGDLDG